ncbi:FecCD family ABC transporter permease [Tannockella kyphosi]|uniref:FecCD family ABC transporter permease n=1 Tax=Tannockella kyphosi TaxID=2899121 RepID=UPI00201182AF|nr:iron ABC transporter permease [Tannockella kyphosi]
MEVNRRVKKSTLTIWVISFLTLFIVCAFVTLTYLAPASSIEQVIQSVLHYDPNDMIHYVNVTIKFPRILGALLVGGSLAVGGAVMQGITRNYLASPDVVGVSSGANLGLTIAYTISLGTNTYLTNLTFSMIGAAISTCIIFAISSRIRGRESGVKLLLAGTALGTLFSSISTAITLWSYTEQGAGIYLWNNSGLLGIRWIGIGVLCVGLVGVVIAFCIAGKLTVLSMGEETAISLGQNVKRTKLLGVISVVFISASCVSVVGNIGFIGLIIPNIIKMGVGEDYRKVVPYSALFGSMLLIIADVISRLINMPVETPVGIVTSIIGIPIFLYLINSKKAKGVF